MTDKQKTPARPNSKWATGKRRELDRPWRERDGFAQGAKTRKR